MHKPPNPSKRFVLPTGAERRFVIPTGAERSGGIRGSSDLSANDSCPKPLSLEVAGLSLQRGAPTLGPVSFALPHPGVWWLTGASGAGKSLLLETLAGFHADARGSIRVAGREVAELAPERRSIALMPQRWRLFPHWTVARNLRFAARLGGADSIDRTARIEPLAERLQVADLLRRATRGLSGGETQRLALIQTLLSPARVLLLDEPLSAIDAALQSVVLDLLAEESSTNQRIGLIAAHRGAPGYPMRGTLLLENGKLVSITNSG